MNKLQIQGAARHLKDVLASKAEGTGYTGLGDALVDFNNATSFMDEAYVGRTFNLVFKNESEDDVEVSLCDGLIGNAGVVLADGTEDDFTIKGSPRKSEMLRAFIKSNPIRILSLTVKADDISQLDEPLTYKEDLPFSNASDEQRIPSNYQSPADNKNIVKIEDVQGWVLSSNHQLLYTIQAGRSVTLTFAFGGSFNPSKALDKKAKLANENIALFKARASANK